MRRQRAPQVKCCALADNEALACAAGVTRIDFDADGVASETFAVAINIRTDRAHRLAEHHVGTTVQNAKGLGVSLNRHRG